MYAALLWSTKDMKVVAAAAAHGKEHWQQQRCLRLNICMLRWWLTSCSP